MNEKVFRVAILANQLAYTDGVSNHLFYLLNGFRQFAPEFEFTVLTGVDDAHGKFDGQFNGSIITLPDLRYGNRSYWLFIKNIATIVNLKAKHHFQLIHSHTHYHANIARIAGYLTGTTTLQTNHGLFEDLGKLRQFNADHYICVARHLENYMIQNKLASAANCNFIRHGIEIINAENNTLMPEKICFIAAGRFIRNKAFDVYIRAVAGLPEDIRSKCAFYLAGTGEEEELLQQLNTKLDAGITFLGNRSDIRNVYAKCDVFINMTRSTEGSPVSLAEAALSGCFIISTSYFGMESSFTAPEDGMEIQPDDVTGLQNAIIAYCSNPEKAQERAKKYQEKAALLFSVPMMVEKTANLYKRICK